MEHSFILNQLEKLMLKPIQSISFQIPHWFDFKDVHIRINFKAIEEKKLSLNQTLQAITQQLRMLQKITISNLLNHRSGIHNFTSDGIPSIQYHPTIRISNLLLWQKLK
jgi:hypothetical protein